MTKDELNILANMSCVTVTGGRIFLVHNYPEAVELQDDLIDAAEDDGEMMACEAWGSARHAYRRTEYSDEQWREALVTYNRVMLEIALEDIAPGVPVFWVEHV